MSLRQHKTVVVKYGDMKEEIDELIAPIISILWKNKIKTTSSCQETESNVQWMKYPMYSAFIQFNEEKYFKMFLDLVVSRFEKYSLEIDGKENYDELAPYPLNYWTYEILPQYDVETKKTVVITTVFFPTKDISTIFKILNKEEVNKEELEFL